MVRSLALRPDDAKQGPVVYSTKFGIVFLAEGPRTASIQKGFDCFGLYHHPGLDVFILLGGLLCFIFLFFGVTLGRLSGRESGDQKKTVLFF